MSIRATTFGVDGYSYAGDGWLEGLHKAAIRGRTQELHNHISQIEVEYPEIAKVLKAMDEDLATMEIVSLTETGEVYEQTLDGHQG